MTTEFTQDDRNFLNLVAEDVLVLTEFMKATKAREALADQARADLAPMTMPDPASIEPEQLQRLQSIGIKLLVEIRDELLDLTQDDDYEAIAVRLQDEINGFLRAYVQIATANKVGGQ